MAGRTTKVPRPRTRTVRSRLMVAWGDIPTWVTAGVAFLTLIGATLAYKTQFGATPSSAHPASRPDSRPGARAGQPNRRPACAIDGAEAKVLPDEASLQAVLAGMDYAQIKARDARSLGAGRCRPRVRDIRCCRPRQADDRGGHAEAYGTRRPVLTVLGLALHGSGPTATAAKPLDNACRVWTAVECRPSARTATDDPGRCASSYG